MRFALFAITSLSVLVMSCAGPAGGGGRRGDCARHSHCRDGSACVMGQCESGRLGETVAFGDIFAQQWFTFPDGTCTSDTHCGPWVCAAERCVAPETTDRTLPARREIAYFDGSCTVDDDCGTWGCVEGWCRDRALQCGDGIVQAPEQCDDGNRDDTDRCRNNCMTPTCGDGVVSQYNGTETFEAPVVTGPHGARGHVCDDGATTMNGTVDVSTSGYAPEHGICQALGADRATVVTWGNGPGENDSSMPHAYNWTCENFICGPSTDAYQNDNCSRSEMLYEITCAVTVDEVCDDGEQNGQPGHCNASCTAR